MSIIKVIIQIANVIALVFCIVFCVFAIMNHLPALVPIVLVSIIGVMGYFVYRDIISYTNKGNARQ